jgi:hypothetical protein
MMSISEQGPSPLYLQKSKSNAGVHILRHVHFGFTGSTPLLVFALKNRKWWPVEELAFVLGPLSLSRASPSRK